MKKTTVNWNVKRLGRASDNGELNFDYPIQRAGGQWDNLQKSLLIHSITGDYPVPPVLLLKGEIDEKDVNFVLDGKQRITNIIDFVSGVADEDGNYPLNAYPLHAETPTVTLDGTEEEFELAGKYFDQLDSDVQAEILTTNIGIQRLEGATDEEIEELFYRWNNGTPLTKQQKARAKMGVENAVVINSLQKHSFLQTEKMFTALQRRRSDDEAVVLQTLMLMKEGNNIESFVADKLLEFATEMRNEDISEYTNALQVALDYANESVTEYNPILKKLHLPTLLIVAKKAHDEGVEPSVFGAWVEDFSLAFNPRTRDKALVKTNYKSFTGAGSVKKDRVLGRRNAMITHFNEFIDRYEPTIVTNEEPVESNEEPTNVVVEEPTVNVEVAEELFGGIEEALTK